MTNGGLYRVGPFVAVAGILALLSGCGRFGVIEREPWRAEAELQCLRAGDVKLSAYIQQISAINGPGPCGMDHPLRVAAYSDGEVALANKLTLGCPMVSRADRWLADVVQPAAEQTYGSRVVQIKSGSYSCRPRNNQAGAKLSEHGFGNAMDVFSFKFADGREVAVKSGWRGAPDEQQFLRTVFTGSCQMFTTVLGPGADMFHYDHIHLDLARHDPRGIRSFCKPVLKFEPTPGEGRVDRPVMTYRQQPPASTAIASAPAAAAPGALLPRGSIPGVQPFPQQAYPRQQTAATYPAAPTRPVGAPMSLAPQTAAPAQSFDQPASEEIDADHDPYAVDD
ncbi:extensin family protein [Terrarubrum flagellatum]|uniref:extensin-like domain-containing protein n=1 Tax=Terrirubrum flagellatum TaxID=2895980 RepID=UPI003145146D